MFDIRSEKHIRFETINGETISVVKAEIDCDTADDLPAADAIVGRRLEMGSIAWDIATGDFYGMNSSGEWIKQGGDDEDTRQSNAASLNSTPQNISLNSGLNRPANLDLPKSAAEYAEEPQEDTEDIPEDASEEQPAETENEPAEDVPDIDSGNIEETEEQSEEDVR